MKLLHLLTLAYLLGWVTSKVLSERDSTWRNCNPSCDTIVKNVSFYPYPPNSHSTLTIHAQLEFHRKIEGGNISLKVSREGQPIYDKYADICDYCNDIGLPCPIEVGLHNVSTEFPILLPKGEYNGRVTAWDRGASLLCVELKLVVVD